MTELTRITEQLLCTSSHFLWWFTGVKKGGSSRWDVSRRHHSNTVYGYCTTAAGWQLASHCIRDIWYPRCSLLASWLKTKNHKNSPLNKWKLLSDLGVYHSVKVAVPKKGRRCPPLSSSAEFRSDTLLCGWPTVQLWCRRQEWRCCWPRPALLRRHWRRGSFAYTLILCVLKTTHVSASSY